jgi:hypothetical protein
MLVAWVFSCKRFRMTAAGDGCASLGRYLHDAGMGRFCPLARDELVCSCERLAQRVNISRSDTSSPLGDVRLTIAEKTRDLTV